MVGGINIAQKLGNARNFLRKNPPTLGVKGILLAMVHVLSIERHCIFSVVHGESFLLAIKISLMQFI